MQQNVLWAVSSPADGHSPDDITKDNIKINHYLTQMRR